MGLTTRKPGPFQLGRFYHQKPGILSSQFWLPLSIWVLIVSWHDEYVDCAVLAALSPPAFRLAIWLTFVELLSKPAIFAYNWPLFHSHSTNISRIANLNPGGERAHRTAQSAYSSCHDMIRTQILNWRQSCRNRNMELQSRFNPAKKPRVYVRSG